MLLTLNARLLLGLTIGVLCIKLLLSLCNLSLKPRVLLCRGTNDTRLWLLVAEGLSVLPTAPLQLSFFHTLSFLFFIGGSLLVLPMHVVKFI